ncbi:hypothetical protein N802_13365 [Knoellia sinensis KCTC 19936]|uniref:Permease n=1 Tax=Knoellia sinensis KCTC 19936 TaxID=1385520 RepID=A0A0A0JEF5_9MICO|nr:hypothetical protein N802_13365 [Knoellia sinensis KCTC 19936]
MAHERHLTLVLATAAFAVLLALGTVADHVLGAAAVAWGGIVLAWGWPELLGAASRFGSSVVIGLSGVLAAAVVALTPDEPYLRHVPVVMVAAVFGMFFHQLIRKDGRERLTQSVAVTAAGLALATTAAAFVPLGRTSDGPQVVMVVGLALALSAFADLGAPFVKARRWMLPVAVAIGFFVGGIAGLVISDVGVLAGVVLGAAAAGLAHVLRRALGALDPIRGMRGQITAGVASVLVTAVPVYVIARALVG